MYTRVHGSADAEVDGNVSPSTVGSSVCYLSTIVDYW